MNATLPASAPPATVPTAPPLDGACPLDHLGVIRARGADAAKFLHGQLTHDFSLLGLSEARLAGYCSPKGRMLASLVGFKLAHDDLLLVCHRDLLAPTLKRLGMFVLRAQCQLSDASADWTLLGVAGAPALALQQADGRAGKPWTHATAADSGAHLVQLPPARLTDPAQGQPEVPRLLWCAPAGTPAPAAEPLALTTWQWLEVHSGVAQVSAPLVEAFVPQMLNYESVGGVNFKKGCYPGQEVVARSQFRGTLKRRTVRVDADAPCTVGQPVYHSADAEQDCGTVVAAAPGPDGRWAALVSLQISATTSGSLHLANPQGPALHLLPLPYTLLEDI
jgi:folate-binding protein YgfZ